MTRAVVGGLLAAAVVAAAIVVVGGSGADTRLVRAEFHDAGGLRPGSLVRVDGAKVGSVSALKVTPRNTAVVSLALDRHLALGSDASAAIRAANLLGEKFVSLTVGDRARPLGAAPIPLARTSTPIELDDVLNVLDPTTRGRLGLLVGELGVALGGRGRDVAATLPALPPALADASQLLDQVSADTGVLQRLLGEADRVAATVARDRRPLGALVDTGARALSVPARRRAELAATLRAAPGTLSQLRATLARLDRAGGALRPAARGLQATAPSLDAALRALPGFDAAAKPALATVAEVAPSLTRLGRGAAPTVRRLRPTTGALRDLATAAEPLTKTLDGSAANVVSVMQNWALAIQGRDAVSHLFRVSLSLTPDILRQLDAYVTGPPAPKKGAAKGRRPAVTPASSTPLPAPVKRALDKATAPLTAPLGPVKQALDQILPPPGNGKGDGVKPLLDFLLKP